MSFKGKLGQVSLESAFALIVTILLLLGSAYIFVWMNKCMVERQERYKETYLESATPEGINFYTPANLSIFNNGT